MVGISKLAKMAQQYGPRYRNTVDTPDGWSSYYPSITEAARVFVRKLAKHYDSRTAAYGAFLSTELGKAFCAKRGEDYKTLFKGWPKLRKEVALLDLCRE